MDPTPFKVKRRSAALGALAREKAFRQQDFGQIGRNERIPFRKRTARR